MKHKNVSHLPFILELCVLLRHLPVPKSWTVSSVLPSRSVIIVPFTLRSVIHLKLTFVYDYLVAFLNSFIEVQIKYHKGYPFKVV